MDLKPLYLNPNNGKVKALAGMISRLYLLGYFCLGKSVLYKSAAFLELAFWDWDVLE